MRSSVVPWDVPAQAAERLRPAVVDVVEAAGFVLDDLEVRPAGRRQVVRVVVDTAEVPGPHDPPAPGPDLDAVAGVTAGCPGSWTNRRAAARSRPRTASTRSR